MRDREHRLVLPRGLIFVASLWLIGSWLIALGLRTPVHPSSATFAPGVRLLIVCIAVGLTITWPLLRLSQRATMRPIAQTMLDLIVLLALAQIVIWPLRLVTPWSPLRIAAVVAMLSAWMAIIGAIVASTIGSSRPGARALAMLTCVAICLAGPVAAALAAGELPAAGSLVALSPITAAWTLTDAGGSLPGPVEWRMILLLAIAAGAAWTALTVALLVVRRGAPRASME